jgi:choline dehydrogenase-like flavoprotein
VDVDNRYPTTETWLDAAGNPFRPGQFYYVGGHTKVYGTAMFRFRERDFEGIEHAEGATVAWPIRYAELEPWYAQAERAFACMGGRRHPHRATALRPLPTRRFRTNR